jgi:hypothetical protein
MDDQDKYDLLGKIEVSLVPSMSERDDQVNFMWPIWIAEFLRERFTGFSHVPVLKIGWPAGHGANPFPAKAQINGHCDKEHDYFSMSPMNPMRIPQRSSTTVS